MKISDVILSLVDKKVVQEHGCVDNLTAIIQIETQRAPKCSPCGRILEERSEHSRDKSVTNEYDPSN
jgi:hypothetical protein